MDNFLSLFFFYIQAIAKRKGKIIAVASRNKRSTTTAIAIFEKAKTIERAIKDIAENTKSINFKKSDREKSNNATNGTKVTRTTSYHGTKVTRTTSYQIE